MGGSLPDGTTAPLVGTLVFAGEDSAPHTIVPRLRSLQADCTRVQIVQGVGFDGADPEWVTIRQHVHLIEESVRRHDAGLVIIDPVSAFLGDANGNKESDVRGALMPLVAMADRTGAASC